MRSARSASPRPARPGTAPAAASEVLTKAWEERTKLENERRNAALKCKSERAAREALMVQRQQERCKNVHREASILRANQTAAVMAKKAEVNNRNRGDFQQTMQLREELRKQRDDLKAQWRAHGKQLNDMAAATRNAASHARNQVRERNLSDAHRSTAELLDMFRQGAESQNAISDEKRMMADRVRREVGIEVVRSAQRRSKRERAKSARSLREASEKVELQAAAARLAALEGHRNTAYRIELTASPERVRQLKSLEAQRKANMTGGLRRQNQALEALALERRTEDASDRQRMHDSVMCQRYGIAAPSLMQSGVRSASPRGVHA